MATEDRPQAPDATGERLVPERQHGELVHAEHLARYRLALQLANSRRVLDVACGAGYGTALLASAASDAVGVDVDEATISYARSRYRGPTFVVGDIGALPFEAGAFELVVSFETIEHVPDPEAALRELRRVLADGGLLAISTPNKHQYLVDNEFHVREFTHEEFVALLKRFFPTVELLLQHNWVASAILDRGSAAEGSGELPLDVDVRKLAGVDPGGELYTVAVCGGPGARISTGGVMVAASVDESHQLARSFLEAERTAHQWLDEYKKAEGVAKHWHAEFERVQHRLDEVYRSSSWRLTRPLRIRNRLARMKSD
jgi:SAM-dependent methyltransferase